MSHSQRNTGKLPALRGMDQATTDYVGRAITWWNSGGIPEVACHMGAPTKPDTYEGSQMAVSINAVLTSGTAENNSFRQRMDADAANLQRLEDIGAAVIWRRSTRPAAPGSGGARKAAASTSGSGATCTTT
jgi:hypothetical protein